MENNFLKILFNNLIYDDPLLIFDDYFPHEGKHIKAEYSNLISAYTLFHKTPVVDWHYKLSKYKYVYKFLYFIDRDIYKERKNTLCMYNQKEYDINDIKICQIFFCNKKIKEKLTIKRHNDNSFEYIPFRSYEREYKWIQELAINII